MTESDDVNDPSVSIDPIDDTEVATTGGVVAGELEVQLGADAFRRLSERAIRELDDRRRDLLG